MAINLINFGRKKWLGVLVLALVSFAVVSPILIKGLPYGYDLPHHYQCAITYVESIRSGDYYPSWSLNRNFGYGGMETRLYPPVSHYTLALLYIAANDWHIASLLTLFLFTFVGSLGVYLWAREYVEAWPAVFAGAIFTLLPYHLNQFYNTFFFAEYAGTAILPFTFVFLSRVCRRGKLVDVFGLGVSFAALILTHLPLTVIGSICFAIYGLSMLRQEKIFSQFAKLSGGVLLGLAGSSFFWVKVLQERQMLARTGVYADPFLDYRLQFLATPFQHFEDGFPLWVYEMATSFYDLMFLCAVILAVAFSLPVVISARSEFKRLAGVAIVFLAACLFATPLSRPLWDQVSILQEVQFPWRWVAIVCIASPVIAAGGIEILISWYRTNHRPFALIITGCLLGVVTFSISQIIRPAPFIPTDEIESRIERIKTEEGWPFWWTIWTRKEALQNKEKVVAGDRVVNINKWIALDREFTVSPGNSPDARLALFYHPNWTVFVNNQQIVTNPDENGALLIPISGEASDIQVKFVENRSVRLAQYIALLSWTLVVLYILVYIVGPLLTRKHLNGQSESEKKISCIFPIHIETDPLHFSRNDL